MVIEYLPFLFPNVVGFLEGHVLRSHFLLVLNEMILSVTCDKESFSVGTK